MKRKNLIFLLVFVLIAGAVYLNRSYAHIYDKIDLMGLLSPNSQKTYIFGTFQKDTIVYSALGDSLTSGIGVSSYKESYPYQFAESLSEKNRQKIILKPQAIPGAKTSDLIAQLLEPAIQSDPDMITLLIGVNDVHGQVSKTEFENNYRIILERLTKETKAQIYLINIPYIGTKDLILPPYTIYFDTQIKEFNKVIKDLAFEYNLKYIDLYTPQLNLQDPRYYSSDLFHPSFEGYTAWSNILYDAFNN